MGHTSTERQETWEDNRALQGFTLLITTLASFLAPFMSSSINLATPAIGRELGTDALALTWVNSVYLLASAAVLLPIGRGADLYGRRRVFLIGLVAFSAASVLCALAGSVQLLIAFRVLQGMGSALIFSTGVAILTSVFSPSERGRVLGINTAAVYTGLSLGPVLGGFLTQYLSWRSIFWSTALLALAVIPIVLSKLRQEWAAAAGQPFDWAGAALYSISLVILLYGISSVRETFLAPWLILGGTLGLTAFVLIELRVGQPILDLRRFRGNIPFVFSNLAALIHYSATFALGYLLSLYLQEAKGLEPRLAGLILLAQPVVMAMFSPLTGWLSDRVQPRLLASAGMAVMAVGLFAFSMVGVDTPIALVVGLLLLMGLGYAFFSSPNVNAVMGSVVERDYGVASSTLGTMRLVGQALSMAIVLLLISIYLGQIQVEDPEFAGRLLPTMAIALRLFTGLCLLGMLASLARGRVRNTEKEHHT